MLGLFKKAYVYRLNYIDEKGYPMRLRVEDRSTLRKAVKRCHEAGCSNIKIEKQFGPRRSA